MKKEKVLEIEFAPVFDGWAWKITYQDFSVLKRNKFVDRTINVESYEYPGSFQGRLYIMGKFETLDNKINACTTEEKDIIEERVRLINEKYGKPKRWRVEEGGTYFHLGMFGEVIEAQDYRLDFDNEVYETGNYFRTREEAKRVAEELRKVFERAKKGKFKNVEM